MPPRATPQNAMPKRPMGKRFCYAYPLAFDGVSIPVLAASGGTQQGQIVGIPGQVFQFVNIGFVSTGPFMLQLIMTRLGGGLFNAAISSETLLGPLDRPGLMPFPIEVEGSESITVFLTNDNGAVANTVKLTFWGFRDIIGQC